MIWDCKVDVDGQCVWQSVISDKETNCNLCGVLLALDEQLIITNTYMKFLLNERGQRVTLSIIMGVYVYTKKMSSYFFLLTYHIVTGVSAFERVHVDMSYNVCGK